MKIFPLCQYVPGRLFADHYFNKIKIMIINIVVIQTESDHCTNKPMYINTIKYTDPRTYIYFINV